MAVVAKLFDRKPLRERRGPVLSDGTALRDMIDFENRAVALRALADPELHRLELERIFARSWIAIAHESEIPNPGDFVYRYIGEDPVIVTRTKAGEVSILLNACSHRGMEVCQAAFGNSATFRCGYHGWVFDGEGRLIGAPLEKKIYGDWDKSAYGLQRARTAIRNGLIFGNFDDDAPSLEEHLGDMAYYNDLMYGGVEWEPLNPPFMLDTHSNWKAHADQNAGDAYHFVGAHRPFVELGMMSEEGLAGMTDLVKVSFPQQGHHLMSVGGMGGDGEDPYAWSDGRTYAQLIFPVNTGNGGAGQRRRPRPGMPANTVEPARTAMLGWYVPRGVARHETYQLSLIDKNATEEQKEMARRSNMMGVAAAIDDHDAFHSMQHAATGVVAQKRTMKYNSTTQPNRPAGWKGGGDVYTGTSKDDTQWNFWLAWFDTMTADEA